MDWGPALGISALTYAIMMVIGCVLVAAGVLVALASGIVTFASIDDPDVALGAVVGVLLLMALAILVIIPASLFLGGLVVQKLTPALTRREFAISYWKAVGAMAVGLAGSVAGGVVDGLALGATLGLGSIAGSIGAAAWAVREFSRRT
jgi:hypothetical protein